MKRGYKSEKKIFLKIGHPIVCFHLPFYVYVIKEFIMLALSPIIVHANCH